MSTAYWVPLSDCPALSAPGSMLALRSSMLRTPDRSVRLPRCAMDRMMPGWGKIAMSGSWLPCTRVLISWLKFDVGENLIVMLFLSAHGLTTAWKSSDCWPVKPYMISMLLLVLPLPPPPPPELRQPAVRRATAPGVAPASGAEAAGGEEGQGAGRGHRPDGGSDAHVHSFGHSLVRIWSREAAVPRDSSGAVRHYLSAGPLRWTPVRPGWLHWWRRHRR